MGRSLGRLIAVRRVDAFADYLFCLVLLFAPDPAAILFLMVVEFAFPV